MRVDLRGIQAAEHVSRGQVTGADGRLYARRGTKAKRAVADELIESGAPLLLEMFSKGQLDWFSGDDAGDTWTTVRPYVVTTSPSTKQLARHEMWNAGVWQAEDGTRLIYLTGHC